MLLNSILSDIIKRGTVMKKIIYSILTVVIIILQLQNLTRNLKVLKIKQYMVQMYLQL